MLYEFITLHRDEIVARTRERVRSRPWPSTSSHEIEHGVPLFLSQLAETLRLETTTTPFASDAIGLTATRHGAELLAAGFNVSQVVHDYGDICQVVTELALEQSAPITIEEFHTLNRCLDVAIAEAVTEHTRLVKQKLTDQEAVRLGQTAHELRDLLHTAFLALHALKRGSVPMNGSTGAVLGRSLTSMLAHVDRELSEVRLAAAEHRRELTSAIALIEEVAATGRLHSEFRGIQFTVAPVDPELALDGDRQLLASAVMNLLHNAFKYTRAGGSVILRTRAEGERLLIEIEDECGGIPDSKTDLFEAFGGQRGTDRSGLGLGLSLARRAVRRDGGDIHMRNMPGRGCVFTADVPLAVRNATASQLA